MCSESHKPEEAEEDGKEGGGGEGEGGKPTEAAGKGKDSKDKTESKTWLTRPLQW